MSDNSEPTDNSLDFALPIPNIDNSLDFALPIPEINILDTEDDNTLDTEDDNKGIMMIKPLKNGTYNKKFYSCDKIMSKLDITAEELKVSHIFDYMNHYKTLKTLLTNSIPIIINDGKTVTGVFLLKILNNSVESLDES